VLQWRIVPCAVLDSLQQQQAFGSTSGSSGDYSAAAASSMSSSGIIRCQTATLSTTSAIRSTAVHSGSKHIAHRGSSSDAVNVTGDHQQRPLPQQRDSNGHPYYTNADSLAAAAATAAAAAEAAAATAVTSSDSFYTGSDTVDDAATDVQQDDWPTDMQLPLEGGYAEGLAAEFADPGTAGDSYEQIDFTASDEFDAFGPDA
jgi:hypothetical protein